MTSCLATAQESAEQVPAGDTDDSCTLGGALRDSVNPGVPHTQDAPSTPPQNRLT